MHARWYTLTEGMERYSDAVEVNALALSRSDTRPASMPPVQHVYPWNMCITV